MLTDCLSDIRQAPVNTQRHNRRGLHTDLQSGAAINIIFCLLVAFPASAGSLQPGARWDWQLSQPIDLSRKVEIFDIHPEEVSSATLRALKERGVFTICYVSVGTLESDSADKDNFPDEIVGNVYDDWPDERFLDVRRLDLLLPIMKNRFEACKSQGFQGVEADNMDLFENEPGFAISEVDGIRYFKALADTAHAMGLAIGQKNAPQLSKTLVSHADFIITESCFHFGFCGDVLAYIEAGKPVLDAEYLHQEIDFNEACKQADRLNISMILKDRDLTKSYQACH